MSIGRARPGTPARGADGLASRALALPTDTTIHAGGRQPSIYMCACGGLPGRIIGTEERMHGVDDTPHRCFMRVGAALHHEKDAVCGALPRVGLRGEVRGRPERTTRAEATVDDTRDLVQRALVAGQPHQRPVADFTDEIRALPPDAGWSTSPS